MLGERYLTLPKSTDSGQQGDAILFHFQAVLDATNDILSGVSIPGIAYALPVLKSLAERILVSRTESSWQRG